MGIDKEEASPAESPEGAEPQGRLIIVTAPSGAGKTTIVRYLIGRFKDLAFSVSATTRMQREHERDGRDYHFMSKEDFEQRRLNGEFIECEEVYPGTWYGTLRSEVERLWSDGQQVIFDVDVRGAKSLQSAFPRHSLSVFIAPPSMESLERRLRNRNTESEESLRMRIDRAREELRFSEDFDYCLVNDDLESACRTASDLVERFLHKPGVEKDA